jgi:DNA-binding response OmpR family regulator
VASDDDELRTELALALEEDLHHVVELDDGLELLDYLRASPGFPGVRLPPPHVIIASLTMTGMDGIELLEELRRRDDRTPFIGLARPTDTPSFARARTLGASFVFETPFNLRDVRAALFSLPGGAFPEATRSHDTRVEACRRGTHFLQPAPTG